MKTKKKKIKRFDLEATENRLLDRLSKHLAKLPQPEIDKRIKKVHKRVLALKASRSRVSSVESRSIPEEKDCSFSTRLVAHSR